MHDYDRRPVTASPHETVDEILWYSIEVEKLVNQALVPHDAQVATYKDTQQGQNGLLITGTTTDGRTFTCDVTFTTKRSQVWSVAKTTVEGTVDMGPFPTALSRVERSVGAFMAAIDNLTYRGPLVRQFTFQYGIIQAALEKWHGSKPVDKQRLRSSMKGAAERIPDLMKQMPVELRLTVPPGEMLTIDKLGDEARKALAAASRSVT